MTVDRTCFSVVVPIYNEEDNLPELRRRLSALFDKLNFGVCEAVLVSDGSQDHSEAMISEMAREDARFRGVFLSRNFGHQAAIGVGLRAATGSIIAVIDGDMQDPPEVLPQLIAALDEGADVAYGVRRNRKEALWLKTAYWLFYRSLRHAATIDIPVDAGDFCCMRRRVVEALNRLPESRGFVRGLRSWVGFRQVGVEYERSNRHAGRPKYNLLRLARLAYDGLFAFSDLPIKIMQGVGLVVVVAAVVVTSTYFVLALLLDTPRGFPTLIISLWFIGGVQMFFLGLLGEYIHRTYQQSLRRPTAIIREVVHGETPVTGSDRAETIGTTEQ